METSTTLMPLLRGGLWVLLAQIASKGSVLLLFVIAARHLNVEDFGLFVSLQAIGLLTAALCDVGFSPMITREVAAGKRDFESIHRSALLARLWLLPLAIGVFVVGCAVLRIGSNQQVVAALLIFVGSLANSLWMLLDAGLRGRQRFRASSLSTVVGRFTTGIISIIAVWLFPNQALIAFSSGFLVGELIVLWLQSQLTKSVNTSVHGPIPLTNARNDLRKALPYAMNGIFSMIYGRMDVILVAGLAGPFQSGIYAPGSRAQDALSLMPATASAAIVPIAGRRLSESADPKSLVRIGIAALTMSLAMTLPVLIGVYLTAEKIVSTFLGEEYGASVYIIRVSIWSVVFVAIAQPIFSLVIVAGGAGSLNWAYGTGLMVALVGHLILDPAFGAKGAAWVAVVRDGVACLVGCLVAFRLFEGSSTTESPPSLTRIGA